MNIRPILNKVPVRYDHFGPPAAIIFTCIVFHFLPDATYQLLQYNSLAIQQGQYWRILTGHLLHTNVWHLFLNCLGLFLLWSLHGSFYHWRRFALLMLGLFVGCSAGLYWFSPDMKLYVGLSGALHGLFVWGALKDIQTGIRSGWLLFVGITVKIYFEQIDGANDEISNLIGAEVAIDAHLYGALTGLLLFLLVFPFKGKRAL